MEEIEVGKVTDFFAKPVVAGIGVEGTLRKGDLIRIKGATTDLEFVLASMQIEHISVLEAKPGDLIGIKVPDRVRPGDRVYKVIE
ncbi:MAG: translation elongation factor-like protein [Dehalococcoidia bacterium]|nr:translation elongation factor-like protein [Dehalococcoidia bacterium]